MGIEGHKLVRVSRWRMQKCFLKELADVFEHIADKETRENRLKMMNMWAKSIEFYEKNYARVKREVSGGRSPVQGISPRKWKIIGLERYIWDKWHGGSPLDVIYLRTKNINPFTSDLPEWKTGKRDDGSRLLHSAGGLYLMTAEDAERIKKTKVYAIVTYGSDRGYWHQFGRNFSATTNRSYWGYYAFPFSTPIDFIVFPWPREAGLSGGAKIKENIRKYITKHFVKAKIEKRLIDLKKQADAIEL